MDLKVKKEPKKIPYPTAVVTIIAGSFFLLGVGISAFTLNAVEESNSRSRTALNIAKLAESREKQQGLNTDVFAYESTEFDGTLTLEYPAAWTKDMEEMTDTEWDLAYTNEELAKQLLIGIDKAGDKTHIETATMFAQRISEELESGNLNLLDSGQTAGEQLVFGMYSFELDGTTYYISIVDAVQLEEDEIRVAMITDDKSSLLRTLADRVNLTV